MSPFKMKDLPILELDTIAAWTKIAMAWLVWWLGSLSLSQLGVFAALVFTILQIIVLLRKEFGLFKRKDSE